MTDTILTIVEENELRVVATVPTNTTVIVTDQVISPQRLQLETRQVASLAVVTPQAGIEGIIDIGAQAEPLTVANPTGDGDKFVLRIRDDGTAKPITYGDQYRGVGVALPVTTIAGKTLYLGFIRNTTTNTWDLVAKAQE